MANPIGFRPTDTEKIGYLLDLCTGEGDSINFLTLPTIDIYGNTEPWDVFANIEDKFINFFTKLKLNRIKKTGSSSETCSRRLVGTGAWELMEGKHRLISLKPTIGRNIGGINPTIGRNIGVMNRYEYISPFNATESNKWVLDEYSLADRLVKPEYQTDRLCTLWHKSNVAENRDQRTIFPMIDKIDRERNSPVKRKRSPGSDGKEARYKLRDSGKQLLKSPQRN